MVKGDPNELSGRAFIYTINVNGEIGNEENPPVCGLLFGMKDLDFLEIARSEGLPSYARAGIGENLPCGLYGSDTIPYDCDGDCIQGSDGYDGVMAVVPLDSISDLDIDEIDGDVIRLRNTHSVREAERALFRYGNVYGDAYLEQCPIDYLIQCYNDLDNAQFDELFNRAIAILRRDLKRNVYDEDAIDLLMAITTGSPFEERTDQFIEAYVWSHPHISDLFYLYALEVQLTREESFEAATIARDEFRKLYDEDVVGEDAEAANVA